MQVETNLFNPIDITVSGLKAHGKQLDIIGSNLANARTTDAGNGQPYRRLQAVIKAQHEGVSAVEISDIIEDTGDFERIPASNGDPRADAEGYLVMPNVNLATELINLNIVSRAYQANAAMLKRYQRMVESTLELLK